MADNLPYRDRNDGENADRDNAEEEEEEEIDETGYKLVKDAVLFAIDVSSSMLDVPSKSSEAKSKDRDSATSAALKCAYQLMQQRIISNPKDMMGVLLFGTKESKFQDDQNSGEAGARHQYPHCYLLTDLDVPEAADVKRLRNLVQDESLAQKILVPADKQVAMANVLFCANQIFTTKAPNFSSRRLFLVTDNDNPHSDSKDLRSSAVVRAKDLYDLGVVIELFPISRTGHEFDRSKFYDDIVYRTESSDPDAPAPLAPASKVEAGLDGLTLLQSLLSSINSRAVHKRAQFSNLPLEFSPDFKITVKGYIIYKRQEKKRGAYIWLDGEKPQIVEGSTTTVSNDVGRPIDKTELRKAFKFGGDLVTFTPEELADIKNFGEPGIRIIGFKDMKLLPFWANLRPSTFIYPSEDEYVGSTRTFSALQQTLLRKDKFALVWFIARRNANPTVAALIPGREELDEKGEQTMPAGLWITPLPFADDIRSPPEGLPKIRAPDKLIDKMREIVEQLQLPKSIYDPSRYSNPALQWHYRILQAIALEEDLPEKPEDQTIPKYRQIDKRAGSYVLEWGDILNNSIGTWRADNEDHSATTGKKRPGSAAAPTSGPDAKRQKTSAPASGIGPIQDEEMKMRFNNGTVNKLTVATLKQWLGEKGVVKASTLKKPELVDEVERFFENKSRVG